jgi:hypothetical protein
LVVVIGAGLAGLSAAITLQEAGKDVRVIEASNRPGGRLTTDYIDGFRLDRGFQLINLNYPEFKRLGIASEVDFIQVPKVIDICIGKDVVCLGDPRENFRGIFDDRTGSIFNKASLLKYLASTPRSGESVEGHFIRSGAGSLYRRVLKPFLMGVFLSDPNRVSAVTGKEVIKSFISGKSGIPAAGVARVAEVLAERVKKIEFNTQVESLDEFAGEEIIVATDATHAAQLLDLPATPEQLGCITWYHCTSTAPTESARLRVDSEQRGAVVNSIVISNLAPSYAPLGTHLISSTCITPVSESEVRRHLSIIWGVPTTQWDLVAKFDIPAALPLFPLKAFSLQSARIAKGIYVAGDYRTSPSQNGALISGRLAALELI